MSFFKYAITTALIAAVNPAALASGILPGETLLEYRLTADELDYDGKKIVNGAGTYHTNFSYNPDYFGISMIVQQVSSGAGSELVLLYGHEDETGKYVSTAKIIPDATKYHARAYNSYAVTGVKSDSGEEFLNVIDINMSLETGVLYDTQQELTKIGGPYSDAEIDVSAFHTDVTSLAQRFRVQGYDDSFTLHTVDLNGYHVDQWLNPDIKAPTFIGYPEQTYVYFDAPPRGQEFSTETGDYYISALDWSAQYPLPIYDSRSNFHSQVFSLYGNGKDDASVMHLEGRKESYLAGGTSVKFKTYYNLVLDYVERDGTYNGDSRRVIQLESNGNIVSKVSSSRETLLFLQHDDETDKRYLTFVKPSYSNENEALEILYEVPTTLEINNQADFFYDWLLDVEPYESISPSDYVLTVAAIWSAPGGHRGQQESVAGTIRLTEADMTKIIDPDEQLSMPEDDYTQEEVGSSSGGSMSVALLGGALIVLLALRRGERKRKD